MTIQESNLKNIIILEEILKTKTGHLPVGDANLFMISRYEIELVRTYIKKLKDPLNQLINENKVKAANRKGVYSFSNEEKQKQASLVTLGKEEVSEIASGKKDKSTIDESYTNFTVQGYEYLRQLEIVYGILAKNPEDITVIEADHLTEYLPSLFSGKNITKVLDTIYPDDDTSLNKRNMMGGYVAKDDKWVRGEIFRLVTELNKGLYRAVSGVPYIFARRIIAEVCGSEALLDLDRVVRVKNEKETIEESALMEKTNSLGGTKTLEGMKKFIEILNDMSSVGEVKDSYIQNFFHNQTLKKTFSDNPELSDNAEKEKKTGSKELREKTETPDITEKLHNSDIFCIMPDSKVKELADKYIQTYILLNNNLQTLNESSRFLCGLTKDVGAKGLSTSSFPGFRHSLLSEHCVRAESQYKVGTNLSKIFYYYYTLQVYIQKLRALPVEFLSKKDNALAEEIRKEIEKTEKEAKIYKEDIDRYISTPKEVIKKDLEDNLKANLIEEAQEGNLVSWYRGKDNTFRASAIDCMRRSLNEIALGVMDDDLYDKITKLINNPENIFQSYQSYQKFIFLIALVGNDKIGLPNDFITNSLVGIENKKGWTKQDFVNAKNLYEKYLLNEDQTDIFSKPDKAKRMIMSWCNDIIEGKKPNDETTLQFEDLYQLTTDIKRCSEIITEHQMKRFENYQNDYMNFFESFKEEFKNLEKEISEGKTLLQLFSETGYNTNKEQVFDSAKYLVSSIGGIENEEQKESLLQKARELFAQQICDDGRRIAGIEVCIRGSSYTNDYLLKQNYEKQREELENKELLRGKSYIGKNGSVFLINHKNVVSELDKLIGFDYAKKIDVLSGYGYLDQNKMQNIVKSYIDLSCNEKMDGIGQQLDEMSFKVACASGITEQRQFEIADNLRKSHSYIVSSPDFKVENYPWNIMQEGLNKLKNQNIFDDFSDLEKAINERNIFTIENELKYACFASPDIKYTLKRRPELEMSRLDDMISSSQKYIEEQYRNCVEQFSDLINEKKKYEDIKKESDVLSKLYVGCLNTLTDIKKLDVKEETIKEINDTVGLIDRLSCSEKEKENLKGAILSLGSIADKAYSDHLLSENLEKEAKYNSFLDSKYSEIRDSFKSQFDGQEMNLEILKTNPPQSSQNLDIDVVFKNNEISKMLNDVQDQILNKTKNGTKKLVCEGAKIPNIGKSKSYSALRIAPISRRTLKGKDINDFAECCNSIADKYKGTQKETSLAKIISKKMNTKKYVRHQAIMEYVKESGLVR